MAGKSYLAKECNHFNEDMILIVKLLDITIYGPEGTFDEEKKHQLLYVENC